MERKHSSEALEAYYGTVDKADIAVLVQAVGPARPSRRRLGDALGFASACALGVCIAVATALTADQTHRSDPEGSVWNIREQMARSGVNPSELLGSDGRRSEITEVFTWRA